MDETLPNSLTVNRISELTDVDRRTLKRRLAAAGLSGGPWPVGVILKALLASPGADPELAEAHKRRAVARARLAEAMADKASGEYVGLDVVERTLGQVILLSRNRLLKIPAAVASRVACCTSETEVESLLQTVIEDVLRALSRGIDFDAAGSAVKNGEAVHEQVT